MPELVPEEIARKCGYKLDQPAPIATVDELPEYHAIIFGTGTRYGNMTAQMRNFLDQTGGLWAQGKFVGKVGSVFTSTASRHGGQESTILTFHPVLLHLGMIIVGFPMPFRASSALPRSWGILLMALRPSRTAMEAGSPPRSNWKGRAFKDGTSPRSP